MRFAVFDEERIEATPGALGFCPGCSGKLIAKCGTKKVWHWAHKGQPHCDHWWESETEWHRSWKDHFPKEWQEIAIRDVHGEMHIADVKAPSGLVLEFQHSPISEEERAVREVSYGDMIWVVDGTAPRSGGGKFLHHIANFQRHNGTSTPIPFNPMARRITQQWCYSYKPVYLDFGTGELWNITPEASSLALKRATSIAKHAFIDAIMAGRKPVS